MPSLAYVLIGDEGFHYTGSTADLEMRLKRHDAKSTPPFFSRREGKYFP
jgi:predicted GIY-YIG superfamily endonuclease